MRDAPQSPTLEDRLREREQPADRPAMYQSWRDLLFAHWRVEPERIQRTLPPGLYVDTFDGAAWVGVVPFFMRNIRPRGLPALPWISNFLELNVRTYVYDAQGRSGVWFYSLDCNQPLAVWTARTFFHLNYRRAQMRALRSADGTIAYTSRVKDSPWYCEATYRLAPTPRVAEPGSFEFYLVERYLLFAADRRGRLFTGRVHHQPYPLVEADISRWSTNLLDEHDFAVDAQKPNHVCGSPGFETIDIFSLRAGGSSL